MVASIASTLGVGSGIDIKSLVDSLTAADRAPKDAAIKQREDLNTAKISSLAEIANGIDTFASALSGLIGGGSLFSQPSVSDSSIVSRHDHRRHPARQPFGAARSRPARQAAVAPVGIARRHGRGRPGRSHPDDGERQLHRHDQFEQRQPHRPRRRDQRQECRRRRQHRHRFQRRAAGAEGRDRRGQCLHPQRSRRHDQRARALRLRSQCRRRHDASPRARRTRSSASTESRSRATATASTTSSPACRSISSGLRRHAGLARRDPPDRRDQAGDGRFRLAPITSSKSIISKAISAGQSGQDGGALRNDLSVRELQRQLAKLPSTTLSSTGSIKTLAEIGIAHQPRRHAQPRTRLGSIPRSRRIRAASKACSTRASIAATPTSRSSARSARPSPAPIR